jgi:hypothetical protein
MMVVAIAICAVRDKWARAIGVLAEVALLQVASPVLPGHPDS